MKTCTICKTEQPESAFRPNGRNRGSTRNQCRACERGYTKHYNAKHPEMAVVWAKARRIKDPTLRVRYLKANPEKRVRELERAREYKKENAAKILAINARRKAQKMHATPTWADQSRIQDLYELAQARTKWLGHPWQVDHIVPLKSPLVCGLHCEQNLQVITALENLSKKNYHWPDMWAAE